MGNPAAKDLLAWYDREKPRYDALEARARELGNKLETEAGREVLHALAIKHGWLDRVPEIIAYQRRWAPKGRAALELVELRLPEVERTHEIVSKWGHR